VVIRYRILHHRLRGAWLTYLAEIGWRKGAAHPPIFQDFKRFGWGPYDSGATVEQVEVPGDEYRG